MKRSVSLFQSLAFVVLIVPLLAMQVRAAQPPLIINCGSYDKPCPDEQDPSSCSDCQCPPGSGGSSPCASCSGLWGHDQPGGMPTFWVSKPYTSLRLEDTPLWWSPGRGQPISFHLSYRQRGSVPEDPTIFGVGTNWSCSWRAFVLDLGGTPDLLQVHKGGFGWITYPFSSSQR